MAEWIYTIRAVREDMVKTGLNERELAAYHEHAAYLDRLTSEGVLVLAGRTQDAESVGIAVINAESEEAARKIMKADPFVAHGVVNGRLQPFVIAAGTARKT